MKHDDMHPISNLEGRYANYFKIGYNEFEFIIDFYQSYSEDDDMRFNARIITNPAYVKKLAEILAISIHHYENQFGKIAQKNENQN